ncbi:LexA family protein [Streptomyces sp. NPDC001135]
MQEIGDTVGMRSRASVHYQLVELETKQAIVRTPGRARVIRLACPARAATTCCWPPSGGRCSTAGGGVRTSRVTSSATASTSTRAPCSQPASPCWTTTAESPWTHGNVRGGGLFPSTIGRVTVAQPAHRGHRTRTRPP